MRVSVETIVSSHTTSKCNCVGKGSTSYPITVSMPKVLGCSTFIVCAQGVGDEEGTFVYNAARPLECSSETLAVLVDEVSMLDMSLAAALLDALPTDRAVQLVLVGAPKRCAPFCPTKTPPEHVAVAVCALKILLFLFLLPLVCGRCICSGL